MAVKLITMHLVLSLTTEINAYVFWSRSSISIVQESKTTKYCTDAFKWPTTMSLNSKKVCTAMVFGFLWQALLLLAHNTFNVLRLIYDKIC